MYQFEIDLLLGHAENSSVPVTFTFDFDDATVLDVNDRTRIRECFRRLGWEHIGGSAWRYPTLETEGHPSEDWFNHVIPALMYFRSIVAHAGITVTKFTLDAHSEAGYKLDPFGAHIGQPIQDDQHITMYPSQEAILSEPRLREFLKDCSDSLQ